MAEIFHFISALILVTAIASEFLWFKPGVYTAQVGRLSWCRDWKRFFATCDSISEPVHGKCTLTATVENGRKISLPIVDDKIARKIQRSYHGENAANKPICVEYTIVDGNEVYWLPEDWELPVKDVHLPKSVKYASKEKQEDINQQCKLFRSFAIALNIFSLLWIVKTPFTAAFMNVSAAAITYFFTPFSSLKKIKNSCIIYIKKAKASKGTSENSDKTNAKDSLPNDFDKWSPDAQALYYFNIKYNTPISDESDKSDESEKKEKEFIPEPILTETEQEEIGYTVKDVLKNRIDDWEENGSSNTEQASEVADWPLYQPTSQGSIENSENSSQDAVQKSDEKQGDEIAKPSENANFDTPKTVGAPKIKKSQQVSNFGSKRKNKKKNRSECISDDNAEQLSINLDAQNDVIQPIHDEEPIVTPKEPEEPLEDKETGTQEPEVQKPLEVVEEKAEEELEIVEAEIVEPETSKVKNTVEVDEPDTFEDEDEAFNDSDVIKPSFVIVEGKPKDHILRNVTPVKESAKKMPEIVIVSNKSKEK